MVKGLGYSLESMMAVVILILFSLGAVQVGSPSQDWSEYQRHIAAQDLTFSMQSSGKMEDFVTRGELGSLQNSMTEISDRDMEVSGAVSNLPLYEISVGYYAVKDDKKYRHTENIESVSSTDECNIDELKGFVDNPDEDPIYRTQNSGADDLASENNYDVDLYFANTDPTDVDSDEVSSGYDTLWVDNGTDCQFSDEDGPFHLNEIFYWGDVDTPNEDDYFDFKSIDVDNEETTLYNASQANNIKQQLDQDLNGINTDINLDVVDMEEIENQEYNTLIFPETGSLDEIDENLDEIQSHLLFGSILILMNPSDDDFENSDFLKSTNLEWMEIGYEGGYDSSDLTEVEFSSSRDGFNLRTFYEAQQPSSGELELNPPGKIVSNSTSSVEPGKTVHSNQESYYIGSRSLSVDEFDQDVEDEEVQSACSHDEDSDLTEDEAEFEGLDDPISILNIGLDEDCDIRGLKFDFGDGYGSDIFVDGEVISVGEFRYVIEIEDASCGDPEDGGCAYFEATGNKAVELMPHTATFDFDSRGELVALGHQSSYSDEQLKMIVSAIHWSDSREYNFQGLEEPSVIDTSAKGGVQHLDVYMPYELNLRWSE